MENFLAYFMGLSEKDYAEVISTLAFMAFMLFRKFMNLKGTACLAVGAMLPWGFVYPIPIPLWVAQMLPPIRVGMYPAGPVVVQSVPGIAEAGALADLALIQDAATPSAFHPRLLPRKCDLGTLTFDGKIWYAHGLILDSHHVKIFQPKEAKTETGTNQRASIGR